MLFVGLDVIGDYVTEINVTSPTGVRELDRQFGTDIAGSLMDAIARRLRRTEIVHMAATRRRAQDSDRLATYVFAAALLHGLLILGVRFSAPAADDNALPTLEVLLVPPAATAENDPNLTAGYIAQRAQRGHGHRTAGPAQFAARDAGAVRRHAAVFRDCGVDAEPAERSTGHDFGAGATRPRARRLPAGAESPETAPAEESPRNGRSPRSG